MLSMQIGDLIRFNELWGNSFEACKDFPKAGDLAIYLGLKDDTNLNVICVLSLNRTLCVHVCYLEKLLNETTEILSEPALRYR